MNNPFASGIAASRQRRSPVPSDLGWGAVRYAVLVIFLLIFLVPFLWIWSSALKSSIEIARDPFGLPDEFLWENLRNAWTVGGFDRYLGNTVIY
ncbi:MAG: hypothetical protein M3173_07735, partial [Chloroflexota bacterium]|nr:hypothetical protein [Chloroflexota bacterium]